MHVCWMTTLEQLTPYADDWDRLAAGVPFRGWTWLSHWWRHYAPPSGSDATGERLAVLCAFDDAGSLLGIAPWHLQGSALHGRTLRQLGNGEVCSDHLGVLCHPTTRDAVLDAMADYLAAGDVGDRPDALRWDLLELSNIDADDGCTGELVKRLAALHCTAHCQPAINCWRLELPTTWADYVASIGKHLRRSVRQLERDESAGRVTLHEATRQDQLPLAMNILVDLHQRRRQMLGEAGRFTSERFAAFHRDVVAELLRHGQMQLWWMEFDGKPVAAEYHLLGAGVVYVYQSGMAPEAVERRPGKMLNLLLVRRAIERGYRVYDFLRGDEIYKGRFGAKPRPCVTYRVVPHRVVAQLRHTLWLAGSNLKGWLKQLKHREEVGRRE